MIINRPLLRRSPVWLSYFLGRRLKSAVVLAFTFFLVSPVALAQELDETRSWTYFFGAVGSCNHGVPYFHAGGGGETLVAGGFGLAGELGYGAFIEASGQGVGLLSPGVVYHFSRGKKTMPFVTGGYTLFFTSGAAHGFYFGGGVNRWMGDRWGIRIEGRNQLIPAGGELLLEARFAIVLR